MLEWPRTNNNILMSQDSQGRCDLSINTGNADSTIYVDPLNWESWNIENILIIWERSFIYVLDVISKIILPTETGKKEQHLNHREGARNLGT